MTAARYRLSIAFLLCFLLSGCSLSIGGGDHGASVGDFSVQAVGQGTSEAEADNDARRNATEQLQAQGYSSFGLEGGSGRSMTSSGSDYQVRIDFAVKDAVKGGRSDHCPCGRGRKSNCKCKRD